MYVARCLQTNFRLAVKIEPLDCRVGFFFPILKLFQLELLMNEAECLNELNHLANRQQNDHVPQFFGAGTSTQGFRFMVIFSIGTLTRF